MAVQSDLGLACLHLSDYICLLAHQFSSAKGSTIKGKNFLLCGANSFFLKWTLFQKKVKTPIQNVSTVNLHVHFCHSHQDLH